MKKLFILLAIFAICLLGISLNAGKKHVANPNGYKVIIMGIDAGTWNIIVPLVKEGKMPNFEKLICEGAVGNLRSEEPMYSPVLWTTIATGKKRDKHGITNFLVESADGTKMLPVTTSERLVKAFWNIASEYGKKVGLSGWYVSWPAEKVNGWIASDQSWPTRERKLGLKVALAQAKGKPLPDRTYPLDLQKEIDKFHVTPDDIPTDDMERLGVSFTHQPEGLFFAEGELPDEVRYSYAQDLSWERVANYIWDTKKPDILGVYFNGVDVTSHLLFGQYRYYRMREYGEVSPTFPTVIAPYSIQSGSQTLLTPEDRRAYVEGRVLERYYMWMNEVLGGFMRRMDDHTVIIVCSDHGFGEYNGTKPVILPDGSYMRPGFWHAINGMVALYGKPIKRGYTIQKASITDITPTLLYLAGIPPAKDMDGHVIEEAIDPNFLKENPIKTVPSYENEEPTQSQLTTGQKPNQPTKTKPKKTRSVEDPELIERLKSLGYIQ
jgi:predicted AlkP superfamily phosphohydrolase/phosphomutase